MPSSKQKQNPKQSPKPKNNSRLIAKALEARKKAYAPYSKFKVGAALETKNGKIYTGCNVENASYGIAVCAERVALFKAVSEGHKQFKRIAIIANTKHACPPCGICRQALFEFAPSLRVIMTNLKGKKEEKELLKIFADPFHRNI